MSGWEWLSPHASFDKSAPVASLKWLVDHLFKAQNRRTGIVPRKQKAAIDVANHILF
jgi:hypothetical protein